MRIPFTKMHGAGNDFVVIDRRRTPLTMTADLARAIGDRRTGIGCDQILLLDAARDPQADFAYRIFNAQGGEVEQCGNGARALALFGLPAERDNGRLVMQSPVGLVKAVVDNPQAIRVDMGKPDFDPASLPFVAERTQLYRLRPGGKELRFGAVSMGNPHAVITVPDVAQASPETVGPLLQQHVAFPQSVNVGFMQILSRNAIALRVFERGAGETRACGTGACAAAVIACDQGFVDNSVRVSLPGGELMVDFDKLGEPVWLSGPAIRAFEGHIDL